MQVDKVNKWCPKCQQYLSRDEFYRNVAQSDGLAPYCKLCWREFCRVRHAQLTQNKRRMQQKEETKRCSRCQEVKPVSDFYKSDQWIDGLHVYCKKCVLAYQRAARESKLAQFPGKYRWKRDLIRHDYFAHYDYQTLAFVSRKMVDDLEMLEVTAVKSRTITWPDRLPSSFAREFILGYFDGDGFITYNERPNRRYPYLGFTSGSSNLLVSIADVIEQHTGIRPGGPWGKGIISGAYSIRVSGNSAFTIDEWLHASGLGLKRKRLS